MHSTKSSDVLPRRFRDGYIFKDVAVKTLQLVDGVPPVDELQRFNSASAELREDQEGGDTTGLSALLAALPAEGASAGKARFEKGDKVVVARGELVNLKVGEAVNSQ